MKIGLLGFKTNTWAIFDHKQGYDSVGIIYIYIRICLLPILGCELVCYLALLCECNII